MMKILVESYPYDYNLLKEIVPDFLIKISPNNKTGTINYVGYCRSNNGQIILILPKIFVNPANNSIFGDIPYQNFLTNNDTAINLLKLTGKSKNEIKLISEYSLLIFSILKKYVTRIGSIPEHLHESYTNIIQSNIVENKISNLDIIMSLIKIHKENPFIYFHKKIINTKKKNKINWPKTLSKYLTFIYNNQPYHFELKHSSNQYSMEDPLLTLFYSTLNYIANVYGFRIELDKGLPIIQGHQFNRLCKYAPRLLKGIKHFYYRDLYKEIIYLLRMYFGEDLLLIRKQKNFEYFLTNNFNLIFEDMIDYIISNDFDIKKFKYQKDGKILDHIYHDRSLVSNGYIYFIGDSKYYRDSNTISGESKYKQFTYAKNLIQMFIDSYEKKKLGEIEIRNIDTEGYNIIPNFFIFPYINYNNIYDPQLINIDKNFETFTTFHFENRLFDRDTFIAIKFDINLLRVMNLYVSINTTYMKRIKNQLRKNIRDTICSKINNTYRLFNISHNDLPLLIKNNFYQLNGKIFRSKDMKKETAILSLNKHEKFKQENDCVLRILNKEKISYKKILIS